MPAPGLMRVTITVEVCNDYSLWPHSGLSMSSLAGAPRLSSRVRIAFYPCL